MISKWTSHLKDPAEIERFKSSLEGSRMVLERLKAILIEREKAIEANDIESFDSPSWAYRQAASIGAKAELKQIKRLIEYDPT